METDDFPVRTGNGGARGDRNALPNRAARQRKVIVRLDISRVSMNPAPRRRALIRDDGTVRKEMGDDLTSGQRIERSDRNVGLPEITDMQRHFRRLQGLGEIFQGDRTIFVRVSKV